jgi:hypothetical protein
VVRHNGALPFYNGKDFQMLLVTAIITTFIGSLPLVFVRKFKTAVGFFLGMCVLLYGVYYIAMPSTIWPLWGFPGLCTIVLWSIATAIAMRWSDNAILGLIVPVLYVVAIVATNIAGSGIFYASHYASMIGPIEEHVWTTDVQPKDPRHMRMVSNETALYLARKAVAGAGAIGSQFGLDADLMTLQKVNDELVYVVPFDFSGVSTWSSAAGVPAYIKVDAEDPERQPQVVTMTGVNLMHYTPGAYFSDNLTRYLRNNGFVNDGLFTPRFELDDNNKPFWVVSTYKPTAWWSGEEITGVATIDPSSGTITRYSVAEAPSWIDRIYPAELVQTYADWRGTYTGGWWNSFWDKQGLTQTETPHLIYGENDKAEWVIGITSKSANDDSLLSLLYVDSRTGKVIEYTTNGGATDSAILNAVDNNQDILLKHLTGVAPQIYNVYNVMTAVVPVVNPTNAFQGVAMVELTNVQDVAFGRNQEEALQKYQTILSRTGQQIALSTDANSLDLSGVIDRIAPVPSSTDQIYVFHIAGVPRIFTASGSTYPKLGLTQPNDSVTVTYVASGEDQVPVQRFDNLSLPLERSALQDEVANAAAAKMKLETELKTAADLNAQFQNLTPEEKQKLLDSVKQP